MATGARAQEAFTFSWNVQDIAGTGTTNSNGIIEPGEDAMIYLNVSFRPGVGGTAVWDTNGGDGRPGTVAGLGEVVFDIIGTSNLLTGTWVTRAPVPGFALSPVGSVDPQTNNVYAQIFGQYILPGATPDPRNDDWFFRCRWRPNDYTPRNVGFRFHNNDLYTFDPSVIVDVGFRDPNGFVEYRRDTWTFNEPAGGFQVVPSPGSGLFLLALMRLAKRNRKAL